MVLLITMLVVQSCSGNEDVQGNPELAIKAIEQDYRLWSLCWFTLVLCGFLAAWFYYQLYVLKNKLRDQGINV